MSIAWTTILIIALLLPGVFFFIGLSTRDRYTREIIKSGTVGDVGLAVFISIIIHLVAWSILPLLWVTPRDFLSVVAEFDQSSRQSAIDHLIAQIVPFGLYVLGTAFAGWLLGYALSKIVQLGYLPFLDTHKWVSVVRRSMKQGVVTAYVMTTTVANNRALMYKGILTEFYQDQDGKFVYVVLTVC